MSSSLFTFSAFVASFIYFAILVSDDQHTVKGDQGLCRTPTTLFHGSCSDGVACNNLCRGAHRAIKGFCKDKICFCIDKCQKQKPGGTLASKLHGFCLDRPSARFHGGCWSPFNDGACNDLCRDGEGAEGGHCLDFKCICYLDC